jgi:hypothetical protein
MNQHSQHDHPEGESEQNGYQSSALYVSDHAEARWFERTPSDAQPIKYAIKKAQSLDYLHTAFMSEDGEIPHDVQLYHGVTSNGSEYTMLLIIQNHVVVTTYEWDHHPDNRVEAYVDCMEAITTVYE